MAWCVARTSSQSSRDFRYPVVLVNEGGAWNSSSHKAVIPRDGYYFIHVGGGVPSGSYSYLNLRVNNERQFTTAHGSNNDNGTDTMARSGILRLSTGDQLTVLTIGRFYSDEQMQTIFVGFLL